VPDLNALGSTLVLVAHPDDETIGCGVLLQRLPDPAVVFATDGAPRDRWFWEKYGTREVYAQQREREARDALGIAGVHEFHVLEAAGGRICDQELFRHLEPAYDALNALAQRLRREALVTHAYEGGHPDHDACSFLARVLADERKLPVWEFPLYHRSDGLMVRQEFLPDEHGGENVRVVESSADEAERKRRMATAYESQKQVIAEFPSQVERFRPQPQYDYSRPPHAGRLNYEAWQWPMNGNDVCAAFQVFLRARQVGDAA
jgi:LmbE family N-acetylglucosaminyl deacetylase